MSKGEKFLIWAMIAAILLSNPPILIWVNAICKAKPLIFGWPTLWVYLTTVWTAVIVVFVYAVSKEKPLQL
jgi:cell division protein FtsL